MYFFDTPDLLLSGRGVIVRARRIQYGGGDSVVKLRPVVSTELPADFRRSRNLVVETAMVGAAVTGRRPLRRLFTKEQRAFFDAHSGDVELNELTVLGPVSVLKQKIAPVGFGRYMTVELWLYPDALSNLELSTKCRPSQALRVSAETRRFLGKHGIDLSEEQETKTRKTLGFFSQETNSAARQRGWARDGVTQ